MCTTDKEKNVPKGTKVVLRRLPRDMTEVDLIAKIGQTPPSIYSYFVPADKEMEPFAYSRCYFTFVKNSEVLEFSRRWNGYRFVDANGNHSIAVVELTANDRIPRKPRSEVSKDPKCGTIENEVEYKQFMHDLEVEYEMARLSLDEQLLHAQQLRTDAKASAVQPTPLTHYIIKEMDAKAQRKMDRRRAARSAFDRNDTINTERKGGVIEIKNSSRGWGPRSRLPMDDKEKIRNSASEMKYSTKESSPKDENVEDTDHITRLFANAKKISLEGRKKSPSGKLDKVSSRPRRERPRLMGEVATPTNTEKGSRDNDESVEAKPTMKMDLPLKKGLSQKRDLPAERPRKRDGQLSRPIKKPSERLLDAVTAATASSRTAAQFPIESTSKHPKKYSERTRPKDDQPKDEKAAEAPNAS
ncbi:hypothetical protein KIN20_022374 [Parelaphostrongylus tenuis]|uniref:UPF3 domain-containing protein n=1 Tax=Parelaphostrongylus tenuis TaxID=148309 RepID=A0AAD5MQ37_PARTN|nr:hypothetical protein KIN20_022374 [Parelaphostrongylus tenuis]